MKVFLLLVYIGGHNGYISVGNIQSEEECHALANKISTSPQGYGWIVKSKTYDCIPYMVGRSQ